MNSCRKLSDKKFFSLCNGCDMVESSGIELLSLPLKKRIRKKSENISLCFLLEGTIEISCGEVSRRVEKGCFFLISVNENYIIRSIDKVNLLVCRLDEKLLVRHKRREGLLYDIYNKKLTEAGNCELLTVKINRYIHSLLDDCTDIINSGFVCAKYMQCKTEELLILLRSYYPAELLARLFYPAFNSKIDFHDVVSSNRDKFFTVEEYAAATNLDRNTFRLKFKEMYGKNPVEWIKQERVKRVFQELMEGNKSITDIISEYKFSNFPNFIRFCNTHYKNTPGNIRKIMEGGDFLLQENRDISTYHSKNYMDKSSTDTMKI